ncbi:MAG TPA: proline--tRNA ligase [Acidimicrobiales bacterium]|nr:proline--tRNA ligase [Acidimicrobiales bacterium]
MVLRMSTLLVRTRRDDPADAEAASHRLLVRAGYIRRVAPGGFAYLPLGQMVARHVEQIVREEMAAIGAQEVHLPALVPREPYQATGRWHDYGDSLFRLQDRRGADFLLAPTHEELFTLLVRELCSSYRDLPLILYQIQAKYRDEARPRGGLLRGREFAMKDSYSFDLDGDGLDRSYALHRRAYQRIFDRLGLPYVIVAAQAGAMGGSRSEEFLAPLAGGEDTFARCPACGLAANTEALDVPVPPAPEGGGALPAAHVEDTPDTPTIASLVELLNARDDLRRPDRPWTAADTLKNVIVGLRHPDGRAELLAVGLPGDRELDMKRLAARLAPDEPEELGPGDLDDHSDLVRGYIGPGMLGTGSPSGVRYLLDPRVVPGSRWVTGADAPGRHVVDLVAGRDFTGDGMVDAAEVRAGDPCPTCGAALELARGLELGHIFQLGRRYAEALGLSVLDERNQTVPVSMGSYGIGISRAVAAIAEVTHDAKGLCWPPAVAPARLHIVVVGRGEEHREAAERLAAAAEAAGVTVLVDDRAEASAGVKLTDAELLGMPTLVVVGRGLASGLVERIDRASGERADVPVDELVPGLG